jgi:hypothetical protein
MRSANKKLNEQMIAAVRKTGERAAVSACTYGSRIVGGSARMIAGVVVVGRCAFGSHCASSVCNRLVKIAPKSDTPIEPPIWRNIVEPDVATPSIR